MKVFTDISVLEDADGIFDIGLDENNRDAALTAGLESAILVSLFSDQRAPPDLVPDPMRRRGWICDLVATVPNDKIGSLLWIYQQSRLTSETASNVASDARNALQWMIDDGLCDNVAVSITRVDATRTLFLLATLTLVSGGVSNHAFAIANATRNGLLVS